MWKVCKAVSVRKCNVGDVFVVVFERCILIEVVECKVFMQVT